VGYTAVPGGSLSYQKISQLFADLYRRARRFGYRINPSTLVSAQDRCAEHLAASQQVIQAALLQSPVAHFTAVPRREETGLRVAGRLHWLHTGWSQPGCSTAHYSDFYVHTKRGRAAIDQGLLPRFTGWAVHDCWASYFGYDHCDHALCGAHLLRELTAVEEQGRAWARHVRRYLLALYHLSDAGRGRLPPSLEPKARRLYHRLLDMADDEEPPPIKSKRGRRKSPPIPAVTKGRNLLNRLRQHEAAVLAFALVEPVPFSTADSQRNQAERDNRRFTAVRGAKLKQNVAGSFRTLLGAQAYARIAGFISTARKQKRQVFKELRAAFQGHTFLTTPQPC
jgi:transposase